tara:strand:- start:14487 stop:15080 length:594 start_codon:yes stop_codon:yes gene_type:complete
MFKNILIKSATRTGSTYIRNFFYNNGNSYNLDDKKCRVLQKNKNNMLHCHKFEVTVKDTQNWEFILSTRQNKFDQICSKYIAIYTNQWRKYSYIDCKINLSMEELICDYWNIIKHETHWKKEGKKFNSFNKIYYETLFSTNILLDVGNKINFCFEENSFKKTSYKSPYQKDIVIKNYYGLKKSFEIYVKKQGITNEF